MYFGIQSNSEKADYGTSNRRDWHSIIHTYRIFQNYVEGLLYIIVVVSKDCPDSMVL